MSLDICLGFIYFILRYIGIYTMLVFLKLPLHCLLTVCRFFFFFFFFFLLLCLRSSLFISGPDYVSLSFVLSSATCLLPVSGPSLILPPSTQDGHFEFLNIPIEGDDLLLCRDCIILPLQSTYTVIDPLEKQRRIQGSF